LLNQPSTQHARSVTLAASGLIGTLLVFGLHSVIVGAESAARERELGGRFRVVRDYSAGATGVLYEGEYCPEGGFSRKVAIRRFHGHVAEHAELLDGFRQAAFRAAQLVHPNIVQVHDFLRTKGAHYLVLEWVDGVSLDALTGPREPPGRVWIPSWWPTWGSSSSRAWPTRTLARWAPTATPCGCCTATSARTGSWSRRPAR
jgi:serine/threonine protein kinase